jgi:hypothetical protein
MAADKVRNSGKIPNYDEFKTSFNLTEIPILKREFPQIR